MTYDPTNIFTQADINDLTRDGIIKRDIIIRGEHLKTLSGVEKIVGFLGLSDSNLESLGELKEITGDFWVGSYSVFSHLKTLGQLERIGGDANLRYSNVTDLGALKVVMGKLSLRDTQIESLGSLRNVGGDLYLPKRLQGKLRLSKITVRGKVRYWNDTKTTRKIDQKENLGLVKNPSGVPYWQHQYIYATSDLEGANKDQRKFYKMFKQKFKKGVFLDLEGNDNYAFILFYDLLDENTRPESISELKSQFQNLEKFYPKTKGYATLAIIERLESYDNYEDAWKLKYKSTYIGLHTILEYEEKLNRPLLDGELIVKLGGYSHLTKFGQNNIEKIIPYGDKQLSIFKQAKGKEFFELFFDIEKHYQNATSDSMISERIGLFSLLKKLKSQITYDTEYYKQFYLSLSEYEHYKKIDDSRAYLNNSPGITHVIEKAIFNQCRLILKKAEDLYREDNGMPKIGEGWISETELYYKIVDSFPDYEVQHHGSPTWLGRQHLDIYFPHQNIALEYQGTQHYVAIDFFGGEEALEKTKERDRIKRRKCEENDCHLIYVDEGYNFEEVKDQIQKLIENGVNREENH